MNEAVLNAVKAGVEIGKWRARSSHLGAGLPTLCVPRPAADSWRRFRAVDSVAIRRRIGQHRRSSLIALDHAPGASTGYLTVAPRPVPRR